MATAAIADDRRGVRDEPARIRLVACGRRRTSRAFGVRAVGHVDEGPPRRGHRDGRRGRALHPRRDREALSRRRDHRRGGGRQRRRSRVWIIDPIDGTANYARGIPHYCVSIGYLEHGVPTRRRALRSRATTGCMRRRGARARRATASGSRVSPCDDMRAATVECGWSTRRIDRGLHRAGRSA